MTDEELNIRLLEAQEKTCELLHEERTWWPIASFHREDLDGYVGLHRTAVEEAARIVSAPDGEPLTINFYDVLCDLLRLDPFGVDIPDNVPGEGPFLEDVQWSAGRYRRLLESLDEGPVEELVARVRTRAGWMIHLVEALIGLRDPSVGPPPGGPRLLPAPPKPAPPADLRTVDEAAAFLRVHRKTVLRHVKAGDLRGQQVGGRWRLRQNDLEAFLRGA